MFSKLVIVLLITYFTRLVKSNDVTIGHATPFSKKIFNAIKEANPALWKRRDYVLVNAPYHDFISAVYVTDLRSDKEGEAYIAAGGIGSKTVTIALKSPSILTGYKFSIDVYAESMHSYTGFIGTPMGGLSGVAAYPSTYPINSVTYPVGGVPYPVGGAYPQNPLGR